MAVAGDRGVRTGKEKERRFFDPLFLHSLTLGTNIQKSNESHQGDITNKCWLRPGGDARQWCAPQPQEGLGLPDEALREDGNGNAVFLAWKRTINQVCFENEHIKAIMETAYFNSHHRIMAYDNLAQQMAKKKVAPDAAWPILGLSAGGSPHVLLHWHPTDHQITQAGPKSAKRRGRGKSHLQLQFNIIYYCRVQLVEQCTSNMAAIDCRVVYLFDIPSSQGGDDPPPSPTSLRMKPKSNGIEHRSGQEVESEREEQSSDH